MMTFSITFTDPYPGFHGHGILLSGGPGLNPSPEKKLEILLLSPEIAHFIVF